MKEALAITGLVAIIGTAVFLNQRGVEHADITVSEAYCGMPVGTVLKWNNGKYVPESMPGYESRVDFPDCMWVYEKDIKK